VCVRVCERERVWVCVHIHFETRFIPRSAQAKSDKTSIWGHSGKSEFVKKKIKRRYNF